MKIRATFMDVTLEIDKIPAKNTIIFDRAGRVEHIEMWCKKPYHERFFQFYLAADRMRSRWWIG